MTPPYTSAEVLTIIAAIGGLMTMFSAAVVNIIVALRNGRKLDANTKVTEAVNAKADVITTHVNGAATVAQATIDSQRQEITHLRAVIGEQKQAALLAHVIAARTERPHRATDPEPGQAAEPLKVEVVNIPPATTTEKA